MDKRWVVISSLIFVLVYAVIPFVLFQFGPGWGNAENLTFAHYYLAAMVVIPFMMLVVLFSPIILVVAIILVLAG
ncbi:MAG: hypothetical protein A3G49_01125 [Candidatus Sungbacteria bacterium RIFCSPLOWO2_12_FULL_41_11]|uniref:Uncharacterized protein n=1 Tax=Candidatus Sungbacteria bacterium RIFCSPLOWO2_12_FULL_41_11 TaxID=1802286 RepID=A0A1G2LPH6_9BACT|nr:MAG: hypothetical protein UV01_C0006G0053 [Parcubacteria group bacterium GW2011_GWA2_42_14]OGZ97424.1 MAG: hypothetical protein A3D41_05675 [Candidatus Sungbacteria bacterium RIFCSPHIGHO2_02_FULL_41_12b]OHA13424.1 MAG: hypothetical protein A3G49_01125 [Candidatus Sungbacteria bacterium RIFCSPLOWO2_12_FULL_41_11]